jgi:hypothetical protein
MQYTEEYARIMGQKRIDKLTKEAEEAWDSMDAGDYREWFSAYAEAGHLISESDTTAEKQEMFTDEYIEINWLS